MRTEYVRRINRVIDYLRDHLDQAPSLTDLAQIACFSEYHFHRVFRAVTGEPVHVLVLRLRLEKAARLLKRGMQSITDIGADCGFSSPAIFAKSFRKAYGQSPSQYRFNKSLENSKIGKALFQRKAYLLPMSYAEKQHAFPVEIRQFPVWNVAYIRVSNAFAEGHVLAAFDSMLRWRAEVDLPKSSILFGMAIDDPTVTPKHLYRYEVASVLQQPTARTDEISTMIMPSRTYAVTRLQGDIKKLATAWNYLFDHWLIDSEFEPDDAPALEIFLNPQRALDWSYFDLELAIPVRKMALN